MDLDDDYLDDVLDEFNEKPAAPPGQESVDEDFMKLLQQNMSQLMQNDEELDSSALLEGLHKAVQTQSKPVHTEKAQVQDDIKNKVDFLNGENLESLMKEFEGLLDSEDFDKVFGNVLNNLVTKDLLYEPMKDLADKYPKYIKENQDKDSPEDIDRYKKQYAIVLKIIVEFDKCQSNEPTAEESKRIMDLMQEVFQTNVDASIGKPSKWIDG
ncbi:Peroxisome chaperone and import receptor [Terramyces sp. JEL0728]|nr:Peroxisome chaperone and import receptor [Terramyces sp. JEL0728]